MGRGLGQNLAVAKGRRLRRSVREDLHMNPKQGARSHRARTTSRSLPAGVNPPHKGKDMALGRAYTHSSHGEQGSIWAGALTGSPLLPRAPACPSTTMVSPCTGKDNAVRDQHAPSPSPATLQLPTPPAQQCHVLLPTHLSAV